MATDPEKLSPWCQTAVRQQLTPHTGGLAWHAFLSETCRLLESTTCTQSWQALNTAPRTHAFHACTHVRTRTRTCAQAPGPPPTHACATKPLTFTAFPPMCACVFTPPPPPPQPPSPKLRLLHAPCAPRLTAPPRGGAPRWSPTSSVRRACPLAPGTRVLAEAAGSRRA